MREGFDSFCFCTALVCIEFYMVGKGFNPDQRFSVLGQSKHSKFTEGIFRPANKLPFVTSTYTGDCRAGSNLYPVAKPARVFGPAMLIYNDIHILITIDF